MEELKNFDLIYLAVKTVNENILRRQMAFTDLVLKSSDGVDYHVHKIILCAACPFLKSVLMKTGEEKYHINEFECPIAAEYLDNILEYIYTGQYTKEISSIKEAKILYECSIYFQLESLQKFAVASMSKRISTENSLAAYRYAIDNQIKDLADNCVIAMMKNIEMFFDTFLLDLMYEEFEKIILNPNLIISQETLYLNIIQWIKGDYDKRQYYLKDLLENVDFTLISDEFKKNKILSDNLLLKNHDFIYKIINDYKNNLEIRNLEIKKEENFNENLIKLDITKEIKQKTKMVIEKERKSEDIKSKMVIKQGNTEDIVNKHKNYDILLMVGGHQVLKLNEKTFHKIPYTFSMPKSFTSVPVYPDNLILLGGDNSSVCKILNIKNGKISKIAKMFEKRELCEAIICNKTMLYACGGRSNKGSMEKLNLESFKWLHCNSMAEKNYSFGLTQCRNAIYAFGGYKERTPSNCIERYDSRTTYWERINVNNVKTMGITKCLLSNDSIFCLTQLGGGLLFDVRQNQWRNDISIVKPFNDENSFFSLVDYEQQIIVASSKNNFFKYNIDRNSWNNIVFHYSQDIKTNFRYPFEFTVLSNEN